MQRIRNLHFYLGIFFAPAIIFFAFSGLLQTFSLHEGEGHQKWIEEMGEVHKNQRPPDWLKKGPTPPATPLQTQTPTQPGAPAPGPTTPTAAAPASTPAVSASSASPATSASPAGAPVQAAPVRRPPRKPKSVPFKIFAAIMSVGLILSSILGIAIAFRMKPDPKPIWIMLVVGTLLPVVMLYLN